MRKTIIGIFLVCMIAISVAGITGGIGTIGTTEPIVTDKEIPDAEYVELKTVLEKGGVTIDDKIGLDVSWTETKCTDNYSQDTNQETEELIGEPVLTGTTCQYELYKEKLFGGATISVTYPVDTIDKQALLDQAIQDKVEFVKNVWADRQAKADAEKDTNKPQTGTTKFITDKTTEEPK